MPQINLSTSPAVVIPQNSLRVSLLIQNLDASINVFGDDSTSIPPSGLTSSNASIRLTAGSAVSLNKLSDGFGKITDSYQFLSASGTPTLAWFETELINRRTGKQDNTIEGFLEKLLAVLQLRK